MTTADYALIVSILSLVVSLGGLAWNVWSKFIYPRGRIRVAFSVSRIISFDEASERFLLLSATNFGPTDSTITCIMSRSRRAGWWWRVRHRWTYGMVNPLHDFPARWDHSIGPFGGGLPKKLAVGEQFNFYLTFKHEHLRDDPIVDVGFNDVFGGHHWASRADVRKVRAAIKEGYPKSSAGEA